MMKIHKFICMSIYISINNICEKNIIMLQNLQKSKIWCIIDFRRKGKGEKWESLKKI